MPNDNLKKYYSYLKSNGADVAPTYEAFANALSDENNAKKYHSYLLKNKFDAPQSYDVFSQKLGIVKKKETTVLPSEQKPKPISSGTQPKATQKPLATSVSQKDKDREGFYTLESKDSKVYTGLPGKEKTQYRVLNNKWQRRDESGWRDLDSQNSIDLLNKYFNKTVKSREDITRGLESNVKKAEVEKELSDKELASVLGWSEQEVKKSKSGSGSPDKDFKAAMVKPDIVKPSESNAIGTMAVSTQKAYSDLGPNASSEDIKKKTKYYDTVESQKYLKSIGYDIDVNGDESDEKTKIALNKEKVKQDVITKDAFKAADTYESIDNEINQGLLLNDEEFVVTELRKKYSKDGFYFEETGAGDSMIVKYSPIEGVETRQIEIPLNTNDINNVNALKDFMKQSYMTASERKNLNSEELDIRTQEGRDAHIDKLLKLMADNPYKYGSSLLSEDEIENHINNSYSNLKEQSKNLQQEYKELQYRIDKFNQDPSNPQEKAFINNKIHELSQKELQINNRYNDLSSVDKSINKVASINYNKSKEPGNWIGVLGSQFIQGITNPEKTLTQISMDVLPYAVGEDVVDPMTRQKLKDKGYTDIQVLDYASKELKNNLYENLKEGITNVSSLGTTTSDYVNSKDRNDLLKAASFLAESIGTSLSAGGNPTLQKVAFFTQSYNSMEEQMVGPEFDSLNEWQKKLISVPYGFVIGALERYGIAALGEGANPVVNRFATAIVNRTMLSLPKDATVDTIKREINKNVGAMIAQGALKVVGGSLVEGGTEATQQLFEIGEKFLVNKIVGSDKEPGFEYFKDVPDITTADGLKKAFEIAGTDFYYGALGGLLMSGGVNAYQTTKQNSFNKKTDQEFEAFYDSMTDDKLRKLNVLNTKIKLKNGEITKEEAKETIDAINSSSQKLKSLNPNLSIRDKKDAFNLMLQRDKLEQEKAPLDEAMQAPYNERITNINNELKTISENAVKESTKPVEEVTAEGGGIQRERVDEGQPEVGQREGSVGQAAQQEADLGNRPVEGRSTEEALKDVESTAKALNEDLVSSIEKAANILFPKTEETNTIVSEAYHADKAAGKETELTKAVEEIFVKPTEVIPVEPTVTEEVVAEKPTAEEVERLGKLLEGTDQQIDEQIGTLNVSKKNNKVAQSIANAAKAIAKILPDVKFVVHDTDESYRKATGEQSRSQSSSGEYNNKTKTIHINASKANNRTAAHEVFHAILLNKIGSDFELQRLTKAMIDSVLKSLSKTKGSEEVVAYLEKFASQYDDKTIFNEEKLAELFGILADNYAKLPADTKNIIQRFIDRVRKILGLKPMTDREVIDFMNTISQKVASGQEITQKDISKISTDNTISKVNKRFQADFSDSVSKLSFIYDKNGEQFKKLEKDGFITRDKSLSDFNGKYIFLHQPDAAFSGMIFKDGEVLVEGKGGVFYPIKFHEDGYFWASTDRTAKKMADDLNKVMEQNGGSIYMALTSAPSDKLMSSTTMANAILDFFSSKALDKNFKVTPTQLKSALRKAANDVKSVNNKKVGLDLKLPSNATIEEMQSAIRTALGSENSSFADRKNFAVELTKLMASEINKNDIAVNQFGKLFSEGIQNKYFKGITKTGKLKISAANMTQALSEMFTEPMLKEGIDREKGGQVYAILELNGPVKAEPSTKHESYPMAIESANKDNKVTLHLLNDRQNWFDTFEDFETGDIVSKERQLKVYPTSGVSVKGLKVNTANVSPRKQLVAPNGKPSNLNEKQWNQVRTPEFKKWFGDWENDPKNASKVIDENGEPLVMYHGSLGEFDEFETRLLGSRTRAKSAEVGFFFSDDKRVADSYVYYGQLQNPNIDALKPIIYGMTREQLGDFQSTVLNQFDESDSYSDEDLEYLKDDIFRTVEYDSEQNILDSFKYIEKAEKFIKSKNINKEFSAYPKGYIYESFLNIKNPKQQNLNGDVFDSTYTLDISNNNDGVILDDAIDSVSFEEKDGGIESKIVIALEPTQIKSATENVGTFSELDKSIRKQKADTISGIVFTARQNGFSDAAISQYLLGKGYTQEQIDGALSAKAGAKSIDDIFEASQQEIRDKVKRKSIREYLRSLYRTLFNRQVDIKRVLNTISLERGGWRKAWRVVEKNNAASRAFDKLVNKAGATGLASIRFKIAAKDIYGKLKEADIKILDKIIYARRIISINENRAMKGLEPYRGMDGYSEVNAQENLNTIKNEIGEDKFNDLNERADKYFNVFKENLKKLKESGRITEDVYDDLNEIEYSPIATIKYIISDNMDVSDMDREASRLGMSKDDIKKLTDRNENGIITDSRYLLAMNISSVESRAFENAMLNEVVKALDEATPEQQTALSEYVVFDNPIIGSFKDGRPKRKYDDQAVPSGFKKVYYFENGIEKYIIVREDVARQLLDVKNSKIQAAIENTSKTVPVIGWALKTITLTPARLLRFFATGGNPLFIIKNIAVDWPNAVFNTDVYSNIKFYGMIQAGFGFVKNFIKKAATDDTFNKTYREFAEHGGLMDFLSNESMRSLNELKPGHKILSKGHRVLEIYGNIMSFFGETSEVAMRLAVYEKMKSNLISEFKKENRVDPNAQQVDDIMWRAAREARELIDFNQGGSWAKEADVIMPYLNTALQGFRKPIEYAIKNPIGFASSYLQLALMGSSIAGMSLAAAMVAIPGDDEEEKKKKIRKALDSISDHEKASYHIIFTGKMDKNGELEYIRIKKLPIASIATTLAEQMMYEYLVDYKFDEATFNKTIEKSLPFSISELGSKNPVVSGLATYIYNKDTFTGEEVFKGPKDKVILETAEGVNDPKIEAFYKSVAPALGLSPARSKAFVEKIITNQSNNPTINIFYAAANGLFGKDTQFGTEFSTAMEKIKEASGKAVIRYTNENVIKYKKEDELEKEKIYITTDKYLKDSKIKADIKDRYNNGKTMTIGELEKIVKENYDPIDQNKYLKKYYTYTQTMNADPVLLDLLYEDDPNIQALIINDTYGPSLEKQELDELVDVMQKSGRKVSSKAWYIYQTKYKNRK